MATRGLGTLTLDLIAKIGGFTGPLDKASRHTKKSMSSIEDYTRKAGMALSAASAAFVAASAVMIKSQINVADEMSKSSAIVGIAIEDLSGLRHAADLSGVSFDQLGSGLNKFNKITAEAVEGIGIGADAYKKLGIELRRSDGTLKGNYELIEDLSDAFSGMRDGAQKSALAQDLFGRSGAKLIPLLNGGRRGLQDFADEAERLGLVISTETGKYSEEFNDNLARLQQTVTGLARRVAGDAIPALAELTSTFSDQEFQSSLADIATGIVKLGSAAVDSVRDLTTFGKVLGEELARISSGIDTSQLTDVYDQIEKIKSAIQNPSERVRFFGANGLVEYFDENELQVELAKLIARRDELIKNAPAPELVAISKESAKETLDAIDSISSVYEKMSAEIDKQIALVGKSTKSAELEHEIRSGLLEGLLAGEGELLIAQQKRLEAAEVATSREKKLMEAADERSEGIVDVIMGLREEVDALEKGESAWLAYQLQLEGATPAEIEQAVALKKRAQALRETAVALDNLIERSGLFGTGGAQDATLVESAYTRAAERIDASFSSMWQNLDGDFNDLRDGIVDGFKTMLGEMAHEAITSPIVLNIQQSLSGDSKKATDSAGAIGAGGFYAAIALAVVAGVGVWNKDQDEKFAKMTAEYRQGTQSLGTILGDANKKSESIANLTDILSKTASDTLSVNYEMYKTLVDIRTGITGVASGFAKTLTGSGNLDINEYTKAMWSPATTRDLVDGLGLDIEGGEGVTNFVLDFTRGLTDSVAKELFKKKQRITDTGIEFAGQTLADILATGAIDAFAYADVETKKKVFGITTSTNSKRFTESLDSILLDQLGGVFAGASGALDQAASIFGLEFEDYVSRLTLSAQSLSLKDLEGEALTAEIEGFFSSTLDNWAGVLVDGSMVLEKFQQIGEGAFETVMRLASETATFSEYADDLNLSFSAVGFQAVNATQHIAELAGGFDLLGNSLASYADKFFSESEKFLNMQAAIGEAYAELGVALPKSRDQFRDLVEGLDLATIAGREQFAALMRLTNATDTYLDALEKEQQVKEEALRSAVGGAFDAFNRALDAQRSELERASGQTIAALQGDIELAALALSSTQSVADSLGSTLKNLRLQSSQAELMNRRAAQAQLITANAISAAGGPLPGVGQLDDALRVLAEPSENLYSTFDEYARDFYTTARNIKALQEASGSQVGIDEQNLKTLQDQLQQAQDFHDSQMQQFDSLLKYYKDEISVLDGIDVSVLSVADAVDRLTQALLGAGSSTVVRQPVVPTLSNEYEKQKTARTMAVANNSTGTTVKRSGLVGGDQDEQSELLKLVKQLVEGLEVSQLAIAKNTNKSSKVLERWDIDGLPAERE